jgi:hypothetical protein
MRNYLLTLMQVPSLGNPDPSKTTMSKAKSFFDHTGRLSTVDINLILGIRLKPQFCSPTKPGNLSLLLIDSSIYIRMSCRKDKKIRMSYSCSTLSLYAFFNIL